MYSALAGLTREKIIYITLPNATTTTTTTTTTTIIQSKQIKSAIGHTTKWVEHYGVTTLRRTVHKIEVKSAKFEKGAE
jgi:malate synthase